jgi:hypothetical protein
MFLQLIHLVMPWGERWQDSVDVRGDLVPTRSHCLLEVLFHALQVNNLGRLPRPLAFKMLLHPGNQLLAFLPFLSLVLKNLLAKVSRL